MQERPANWMEHRIGNYSWNYNRENAEQLRAIREREREREEERKEKENEMKVDEDEEYAAEPSSDPLGNWGSDALNLCDALCTESLISLSEDIVQGDDLYSLEEAMEYAFNAKESSSLPSEPNQWKDIAGRPDAGEWRKAAADEFQALLDNETFVPVKLPAGRNAIGCRWVFKLKRRPDGSIDRYKARLVAKGFSQRPGLDFGQVFAPTARWAALRSILAIAAIEDMELHSLDISNAFLNGDMHHEVFMTSPEGFKDRFGEGDVLKLKKALYGLKQAGREWHEKLDSAMKAMGFTLVKSDSSVWVYRRGDTHIIAPVYVDDLTAVTKSKKEYTDLRDELKKHFKLKDLGETSSLLGVCIERDRSKRTIKLSQCQYAKDILSRFGFSDVSTVSTPLPPGHQLSKEQAPKTDEDVAYMREQPYSQLVGALMYLAIATRPDIAHSVGLLARFSSNPGVAHWKALKHLCRYVQGSKEMKLCYSPDPETKERFVAYADADFGGDLDGRRSTSGMVVKMGTGAISWSSKLQSILTLSTTEAEYISAVSTGQEILWLRNFLQEIGFEIKGSSTLYLDNQSAIAVSRNPEHHGRMKHLDLRFYWLRDVCKAGFIDVKYIGTKQMPADIMTKTLPRPSVVDACEMLGLRRD